MKRICEVCVCRCIRIRCSKLSYDSSDRNIFRYEFRVRILLKLGWCIIYVKYIYDHFTDGLKWRIRRNRWRRERRWKKKKEWRRRGRKLINWLKLKDTRNDSLEKIGNEEWGGSLTILAGDRGCFSSNMTVKTNWLLLSRSNPCLVYISPSC